MLQNEANRRLQHIMPDDVIVARRKPAWAGTRTKNASSLIGTEQPFGQLLLQ
jgi:hypothetical protein